MMLDQNEIAQVRHTMIGEMAHIYRAIHQPHGSYRYLVELAGVVCYAHSPVGRVLFGFDD